MKKRAALISAKRKGDPLILKPPLRRLIDMDYSIRIEYSREDRDFWIYINGEVEGFANSRSEAEIKAESLVSSMKRQAREYSQQVAAAQPISAIPFFDNIEKQMEPWEKAA